MLGQLKIDLYYTTYKYILHLSSGWIWRADCHFVIPILKNLVHTLFPKWVKWVKVAQLCPTLCDPMDYRVHGILQARILECVAFPFSRGSSQPRDQTQVSYIADRFFISWATREAQEYWRPIPSPGDLPNPGIEPVLLHCRWILYQLSYVGSPRMW